MKAKKGKFYWEVIAVATLFVGGMVVFLDFMFYLNGWDFNPFAGIAKPLMGMIFIAPVSATLTARSLLSKKGYSSFLEIFVHFLLIGMLSGLLSAGYSYLFDTQIAPDHRRKVAEVYIKGLAENCKEVQNKDKKVDCLKAMADFQQQMELELKHAPELGLYVRKGIIRFMAMGMFYGLIFGFIFSKIYVKPKEETPPQP
jgi:hypothetical protein